MKISICILTIFSRSAQFGRLQAELWSQTLPFAGDIEIIVIRGNSSIGEKRNRALNQASGEYVCFFDDDDWPGPNYINWLMKAVESDCDCASLKGEITWDGKRPEIFEHSIKYNAYETVDGYIRYLRYPNHLNLIRSSIAKQFKFPEINHGEDTDFATQIFKSGLLKKEFYISEIIYYYRYVTNKTYVQSE